MRARRRVLLEAACLLSALTLAAACGGGGAAGAPPAPTGEPPANLTYTENPATCAVGVAITPNAPAATGGVPTSYQVTPTLSPGLVLDATTGVIDGTPTTRTPTAGHVVTAANAWGSTQVTLTIPVDAALPAAFDSLAARRRGHLAVAPERGGVGAAARA